MVKININGLQIKEDALILNKADIRSSGDIDIGLEQISAGGRADILKEASLEEIIEPEASAEQSVQPHNTVTSEGNAHTVAKGVGSFLRDVATNVASGFITGK